MGTIQGKPRDMDVQTTQAVSGSISHHVLHKNTYICSLVLPKAIEIFLAVNT